MTEKTLTLYFADDGTPFKENKDACQIYDKICQKYKLWIGRGKVMFWSHQEKYMNFDIMDYTFKDDKCYLDWLRDTLTSTCGFVVINAARTDEDFEELFEFVSKYCGFGESEERKIKPDYQEADLLAFDSQDCRFHNFSLVARRTAEIHERLNLEVANVAMANKDKWSEL